MARHRHLNRFKSLIVVRKHLSLYFIDNNIISWWRILSFVAAFSDLLSDLGIGQLQNGTAAPADDSHAGHDHERKKRQADDHDHDHDHDHEHDHDHDHEHEDVMVRFL